MTKDAKTNKHPVSNGMSAEQEKSVGCIVYKLSDSGRPSFLVVKDMAHGNWGFPKGHMESGESEKETAKREVKEEVGLDIDIENGFREEISYELKNGTTKQVVYFLAKVNVDAEVAYTDGEIEDHRWLSMYEAIGRVTFVNAALLVQKAKQFLDKNANI